MGEPGRRPFDAAGSTALTTSQGKRGAVLIVVLGILVVLALLATTFATLQATERDIARNYIDAVRAKLLAQSGVEDALSRLKDIFPARTFDAANPRTPQPWKYWGTDKGETVDPPPVRLEDATNPSFAIEAESPQNPLDSNVRPLTLKVNGKEVGFSGAPDSGTYAIRGDHYALKVSDLSGRIYVNDGLAGDTPGAPPRLGSVSQNLRRILNVLGSLPGVNVPQLGDKVLNGRPASGYRHVDELRYAVGGSEAVLDRFRDFVTAHAWVDPNVANPVPLSRTAASRYPVQYHRGETGREVYRMGTGKDSAGQCFQPPGGYDACPHACPNLPHDSPAVRVYGLDTLNPQWIEVVSRAPVNVNTAPREVLTALLADLKGFFLADRRRNNPNWNTDFYTILMLQSSYSPEGTEGDEIGYLMETQPILAPSGTSVSGQVYADLIADEIIACRKGLKSPRGRPLTARSVLDYGDAAACKFGGPFRGWHQFNQFVDNLVEIGVIEDTRALHFDYDENTKDPRGYGNLVASGAQGPPLQKRHASQAIADVIKANFNPNLHLNELNPDENLFLRVDKTDLVVNSTEFAFLPTGYFEVESLGRVVRPPDGVRDATQAPSNELVAQAKVVAVVKLYDLYRETTQKQFYAGTLRPRAGPYSTNNNLSLEVGPEPDNGVFAGNLGAPGAADNEWGGYVALPTMGGIRHAPGGKKERNTLLETLKLPNEKEFEDAMHVHFTLDFDAHHHVLESAGVANARAEIASRSLADETVTNYPDQVDGKDVPYSGPYDPTKGAHRLARSFRQPSGGGTVTGPALAPYAPSDLRIDGGFMERHSTASYYTSTSKGGIWNWAGENARGMVSFWFKPSFYPELSGKIRTPWDLSRHHACFQGIGVFPFALWFVPTHFDTTQSEANTPLYGGFGTPSQCHPTSMIFGSLQWHDSEQGRSVWATETSHCFGTSTRSLNHIGHPDEGIRPSFFRGHRWMHVSFSWHLPGTFDQTGTLAKIYINGELQQKWSSVDVRRGEPQFYSHILYWDKHDGGEFNQMRLGAPSQIAQRWVIPASGGTNIRGAYRGNHTMDSTFDEFYVWKESPETLSALDHRMLWDRGRYYKPSPGAGGAGSDATFTSQEFSLTPAAARVLAPPAGKSSAAAAEAPTARILGVSWTWLGEPRDDASTPVASWDGRQVLYDHGSLAGAAMRDVKPRVRLGLMDGGTMLGGQMYDNDGFSEVRASDGTSPVLQNPAKVQYVAEFRLEEATLGTVLLATPVLDDVTVYWDDGRVQMVSYVFENRSH